MKSLILSILVLSLTAICFAQSNQTEALTISTYYPAPYGVYRNLRLSPSPEPTSGIGPGLMYYNATEDSLKVYTSTSGWTKVSSGLWAENVTTHNIYNTNTGKVGIGTVSPSMLLDVQSSAGAHGSTRTVNFLSSAADWGDAGTVNIEGRKANWGQAYGISSIGRGNGDWGTLYGGIMKALAQSYTESFGTYSEANMGNYGNATAVRAVSSKASYGQAFGVSASSTAGSYATAYGIYAAASAGNYGSAYGIYATSSLAGPFYGGNYAGYFAGPLYYSSLASGSSDSRLKRNIKDLDGNVLDKLKGIHAVTFDWRTEEFPDKGLVKGRQIGLIAQEVEKSFPELVGKDKDGYKTLSYDKFTAVLLEAVNLQQKEIESLKKEMGILKKKIPVSE